MNLYNSCYDAKQALDQTNESIKKIQEIELDKILRKILDESYKGGRYILITFELSDFQKKYLIEKGFILLEVRLFTWVYFWITNKILWKISW